jgi:hypothetical protein
VTLRRQSTAGLSGHARRLYDHLCDEIDANGGTGRRPSKLRLTMPGEWITADVLYAAWQELLGAGLVREEENEIMGVYIEPVESAELLPREKRP